MANEQQRAKKAHGNVEGEDFYYRDNRSKVPLPAAFERSMANKVQALKMIRGKVYAVKNNPKDIERTSVGATEGGAVSVPIRGEGLPTSIAEELLEPEA